jgi:hypothetical protein
MKRSLAHCSLLVFCLGPACAQEDAATRVEVEIGSDLGKQLGSVEVAIRDLADRSTGEKRAFQVGANLRLPFSFAVAPNGGGGMSFVVVVTGFGSEHQFLAQAKARASFENGRVIKVGVWLPARCSQRCEDGQSCSANADSCAAIPLATPGKARVSTGSAPAAGSGGSPAVPALGVSCTGSGDQACAGGARLICREGKWSDNGACDGDTRCSDGECQPVSAECRGKAADSRSCDGADRIHCSGDLLHVSREACPAHASCDPKAPAQCRCDDEYQQAPDGSCMPLDHCPAGACAGGKCVSAAGSFSCTCGAGYSGTGTQSCTAISCEATGVCGAYECRDRAPSYECVGQFAGWPVLDRLSATTADVSQAGVVIDKTTGLMWQRELQRCSPSNLTCTWAEAVTYCAELVLAGHDDWRLPTPIELLSIMDVEISNPALDSMLFPDTPGVGFWTASRTHDKPETDAWYVNGYHASVDTTPMTRPNRARCMRLVP